jgi:hypothetical protein
MPITTNIIETAANVARDYANKGITITPLANTPIADIRTQSRVSTAKDPQTYSTLLGKTTEGALVDMPNAVSAVQNQLDGYQEKLLSPRADVTNKYVEMIYPQVLSHLSFARNVVKPIVVSAIENFQVLYTTVQDPANDIPIVRKYKPDLYKCPEFVEEVALYQTKGVPDRRIASETFNLPKALQYQEIIDFLKSSLPAYSTEISTWLNRLGSANTERLWNSIFNATKPIGSEYASNRDDLLVMDYLMCKAMRDNPPEGVKMALSIWRGHMDDHIYARGESINYLVKQYAQSTISGMLVLSGGSNGFVQVDSDEYDRYLELGGTDQLLKANAIATSNQVFHTKSIIAETQRLTNTWNTYVANKITLRRADQINIARKSAFAAIDALITTDYDKLFGWRDAPDTPRQLGSARVLNAKAEFKTMCEKITINTLSYMGDWFIRSICKAFYDDTSAYTILNGIDKSDQSDSSSNDIAQSAAIATLEYICQYVADQLVVSKNV